MRSRISVVDSNVLFSIELTDLFVTFAKRRLIQVRWSRTILDEVRGSLLEDGRLAPAAVEYRINAMQRALPDAMHSHSLDQTHHLRVAPNDRHVLALAIASGADSIITLNTRDFPSDYCSTVDVEILSPDEVLTEILNDDPLGVKAALQEISQRRRMPLMTVVELLERWALILPKFAHSAILLIRG